MDNITVDDIMTVIIATVLLVTAAIMIVEAFRDKLNNRAMHNRYSLELTMLREGYLERKKLIDHERNDPRGRNPTLPPTLPGRQN